MPVRDQAVALNVRLEAVAAHTRRYVQEIQTAGVPLLPRPVLQPGNRCGECGRVVNTRTKILPAAEACEVAECPEGCARWQKESGEWHLTYYHGWKVV